MSTFEVRSLLLTDAGNADTSPIYLPEINMAVEFPYVDSPFCCC